VALRPDIESMTNWIEPMTVIASLPPSDRLNVSCVCRTLDPERLRTQLEVELPLCGLAEEIARTRPHLFSSTVVFLGRQDFNRIGAVVSGVEAVLALPSYQAAVLARSPEVARFNPGPGGVFLGFDFHLGSQGPQLIEINTNAGGALLNAPLARAQIACCREMELAFEPGGDLENLEAIFYRMFLEEWRLQRGERRLGTVVIVDDAPSTQYLYPEFRLFEHLFRRFGSTAATVDARDLTWRDQRLWHGDQAVDMVYNRLTDFYFEDPRYAPLRDAYLAGAVVVTPNPRAHAIYADKRNLTMLSDAETLTSLGVPADTQRDLLAGIPRTVSVTPAIAEALWAERRQYFFKPAAGYGSKAAYRGDKLTKRVWSEIVAGDYVAQALVLPSTRRIEVDGVATELKLDIRAYVYCGKVQLVAARLYSGQTTNFRTPGGGFAPIFVEDRLG
jgi:hypothetical protein